MFRIMLSLLWSGSRALSPSPKRSFKESIKWTYCLFPNTLKAGYRRNSVETGN
ncbi:hypothetical protein YC2023_017384 [Brassica napus]